MAVTHDDSAERALAVLSEIDPGHRLIAHYKAGMLGDLDFVGRVIEVVRCNVDDSQRDRLQRLIDDWASGECAPVECAARAAALLLEVAPHHRLLRVRAAGAIGDFDFAFEAVEALRYIAGGSK